MSSDSYATVECVVTALTKDAVQIDDGQVRAWIPRSLIHGGDETRLSRDDIGGETHLRIFRWKLEREGLL